MMGAFSEKEGHGNPCYQSERMLIITHTHTHTYIYIYLPTPPLVQDTTQGKF